MKQSDGADLLGADNPHSADIGIIYVAPDDSRQSVLTAIWAQERLHREQIALVLPKRNNAFNRPVDFDGLKDMRGDLQAELVVIAPPGSSPLELARRRLFSVYSSLETFAQSLRDDVNAVQEAPQSASDHADDDEDNEIEFPLVAPPIEDVVTPPGNSAAQAESEPAVENTGSTAAAEDSAGDEEQVIVIPPPPRVNSTGNYPVPVGDSAQGVVPPANPSTKYPSVYMPGQRRRRRWWIAIPIVLLLLVIGFFVYRPLLDLIFVPQATVTITPASKELKHTYTLAAVIGTPDPTQSQVKARLLYAASVRQQETVNASGTARISAVQAVGTLNFYNSSPTPQTIPKGTVFVGASGVQVVNDDTVTAPAGAPPAEGTATSTAHAVTGGTPGNIPAFDLSHVSCCGDPGIIVQNESAFTGGMDAQTYSYVQQSDIDTAANALATRLTANTQATLMQQVKQGEQLVQPPQCTPKVTTDQSAGDHSSTVTVGTTVVCTGEVYDQRSAFSLAANLLMTDPTLNPGTSFVPVGHVVTTMQQATLRNKVAINLLVFTEGLWVYQFDQTQIHTLRNLIVGKSQANAQSLLLKQQGVDKTSIHLYGGNGTTLPSDINQIRIDILNVSGLP
jgi:hypothetical protein